MKMEQQVEKNVCLVKCLNHFLCVHFAVFQAHKIVLTRRFLKDHLSSRIKRTVEQVRFPLH